MSVQRWTSQALPVPRDEKAPWTAAELEFEGIEHDGPSFVVQLYLDNPEVPEDAGPGGDGYAGQFTVFAHGRCWGDVGHCEVPAEPLDAFDQRPLHPLTPINLSVDITEALTKTAADAVTVTALASCAKEERDEPLRFARVSLMTYE